MPEVPDALPAPKSLGGLLKHIESDEQESEVTGFEALSEWADDLSGEIEERKKLVSELLAQDEEESEIETESEKEVWFCNNQLLTIGSYVKIFSTN